MSAAHSVTEAILTSPEIGTVRVWFAEDGQLRTRITAELGGHVGYVDDAVRMADRLAETVRRLGGAPSAEADPPRRPTPFGDWLLARCERETGARTPAGDLFRDYVGWCDAQGAQPMSNRAFGDALRARQILFAGKDHLGRKFRGGVRLKAIGAAAPTAAVNGAGE